jgi:hypothetical protein
MDQNTEVLLSLAECPVCQETKIDNRTLACGHSFCFEDLSSWVQAKGELLCPLCKKKTNIPPNGIEHLQKDFNKNQLVDTLKKMRESGKFEKKQDNEDHKCVICEEDTPATQFCGECKEYYCDEHPTATHLGKKKSHKIIPLSELMKQTMCPAHGNNRAMKYCTFCKSPVCKGKCTNSLNIQNVY